MVRLQNEHRKTSASPKSLCDMARHSPVTPSSHCNGFRFVSGVLGSLMFNLCVLCQRAASLQRCLRSKLTPLSRAAFSLALFKSVTSVRARSNRIHRASPCNRIVQAQLTYGPLAICNLQASHASLKHPTDSVGQRELACQVESFKKRQISPVCGLSGTFHRNGVPGSLPFFPPSSQFPPRSAHSDSGIQFPECKLEKIQKSRLCPCSLSALL